MEKQVVPSLALPPGSCICCGESPKGPVLDTGRTIGVGAGKHRVYLCPSCIDEGSTLFGRLAPNKQDELVAKNAELSEINAGLAARVAELEAQVEAVSSEHVKSLLSDARKQVRAGLEKKLS